MKQTIYLLLLAFVCFSCSKSKEYKVFATDSASCWNIDGDVEQSEEELVLRSDNARATTTTAYEDFILEFECKTSEGARGGVYFHSRGYESLKYGYEVLINNNRDAEDWRKTGSLAGVRNFGKCMAGNEDWVPMRIEVRGMNVQVYVKDYQIVDYYQPQAPYRLPENAKRKLSEGVFVFINHSDYPISFRNVRVKVLEESPRNIAQAMDEQEDELIRLHQMNFPLIDSHLHLCDELTVEDIEVMTRKYGITYGIAPGCGLESQLFNDEQAEEWLAGKKDRLFFLPLQEESPNEETLLSPHVIKQFDYIISDALAWVDLDYIRSLSKVKTTDEQVLMDLLVDYICNRLAIEPIDVYANATLLPEELRHKANILWTKERMERVVDACLRYNTAIEISSHFQVPSKEFVDLAKEKGAKFALGTNNHSLNDIDQLAYAIRIIKECELTAENMFIPSTSNTR